MNDDLANIYTQMIEESWNGMVTSRPTIKGGYSAPQDSYMTSPMSVARKGMKMGGPDGNEYSRSVSSGNNPGNPGEQEEGEVISKDLVINIIDRSLSTLDPKNKLDESAIFALTTIKKQLK